MESLRNLSDLTNSVDASPVVTMHLDQQEVVASKLYEFDSFDALRA